MVKKIVALFVMIGLVVAFWPKNAAGASSDCTPMISILGFTVLATIQLAPRRCHRPPARAWSRCPAAFPALPTWHSGRRR